MASRRDQENRSDDKFVIFVADVSDALLGAHRCGPVTGKRSLSLIWREPGKSLIYLRLTA